MRYSKRRQHGRVARFESLEPRMLLSGQASDLTGLNQVRAEYGFAGSGQTVAVIDTGIAYDHAALGGGFGAGYRVVGGFDFTDDHQGTPYDTGPAGGHGTHVAGIVGSTNPTATGVAPGADLVALRVFDDQGHGQYDWVKEALQWVHDHRNSFEHPITTVNLSLGTAWNSSTPPSWAMLEPELAQLQADGIFIAVAAGNSFAAYNQPGLSYPAASSYVVPVGSVDADGTLSYFSQRDARMIAAPGRSILSTVPDSLGNQNGVGDDFARFSGTSMAAPYVAGASALVREAYQFVGLTSVTKQMLYQTMVTTADTIHDAATGQDYHRLNIDRAIDSIMPADDFGSTAATACNVGTIAANRSLAGIIGKLNDQDWFTFTAAATGTVTVSIAARDQLAPKWQQAGATRGVVSADGTSITYSVVAGRTYTFGLATAKGLGHYTLNFQVQSASGSVDWGAVGQALFSDNRISTREQTFTFKAAVDGALAIEALSASDPSRLDLQLFDAQGRRIAVGRMVAGTMRIDAAVKAGAVYRLKVRTCAAGGSDTVDFRLTSLAPTGKSTKPALPAAAVDQVLTRY
jgi:subtilisin family serine protease